MDIGRGIHARCHAATLYAPAPRCGDAGDAVLARLGCEAMSDQPFETSLLIALVQGMSRRGEADVPAVMRRAGLQTSEEVTRNALNALLAADCLTNPVALSDGGLLVTLTPTGLARSRDVLRENVVKIRPETEPRRPRPPAAAGVLAGLRVLVVEDVAALAWNVADILAEAGASVVGPVPSVKQALSRLARETVDLALLDFNLRGSPSDPVADRLVELGVGFVFLTGYGVDGIEGRHAARPTLGKPVQAEMLIRELAALAAKSGRRRSSKTVPDPGCADAS